jgi:uncharacterized protein (DUF4415 family)
MEHAIWKRNEASPEEGHSIEKKAPGRRRKIRITAAFAADMVKWFRAMGHGSRARMTLVLRTFMASVISREIRFRADEKRKGNLI